LFEALGETGRCWADLGHDTLTSAPNLAAFGERAGTPAAWDAALATHPAGGGIGLVVPVRLESPVLSPGRQQAVRNTVALVRRALPDATVVVQVMSEEWFDVVRAAAEVGASPVERWAAFALACPRGRGAESISLQAEIQILLAARELTWDMADDVLGALAEQLTPAQFVARLNEISPPVGEEVAVLRLLRAVSWDLAADVLAAHAKGRDDPGRFASLEVAAEHCEDLALWLRSRGEDTAPQPGDLPMALLSSALTAAFIAESLRAGVPVTTVESWLAHGAGTVRGPLRAAGAPGAGLDLAVLSSADDKTAPAAAHAAIRSGFSVTDLPGGPDSGPLFWAMLGRSAVDDRFRDLMTDLADEDLVVGHANTSTLDIDALSRAQVLRGQLPQWGVARAVLTATMGGTC
jgi:hypothetical protein